MDDVPQFADNPVYREFLERIASCAEDPQALADLALETGGCLDITAGEEHDLVARVRDALDATGHLGSILPTGLVRCVYCGGVRDEAPGASLSLCYCGGIPCRRCHAGRIHRPISDYFDIRSYELWHAPHFAARGWCKECGALTDRLGEERAKRVQAALRTTADALLTPTYSLSDQLPAFDLLALSGDVETWHDLELGSPPDGRPLFVGRAVPELRYSPRGVRVGTWKADGDIDVNEVLAELLVRWRPPLNREIGTPWSGRLAE